MKDEERFGRQGRKKKIFWTEGIVSRRKKAITRNSKSSG